jgi:hypothetical protein
MVLALRGAGTNCSFPLCFGIALCSKLRLWCLFSDVRGSYHDVTVTLSSLGTIKLPIAVALDTMKAKGQSNKLHRFRV